jgi:hypothetical protein
MSSVRDMINRFRSSGPTSREQREELREKGALPKGLWWEGSGLNASVPPPPPPPGPAPRQDKNSMSGPADVPALTGPSPAELLRASAESLPLSIDSHGSQ